MIVVRTGFAGLTRVMVLMMTASGVRRFFCFAVRLRKAVIAGHMERMRHWLQQEQPEATIQHILEFLEQTR